MVTGTRYGGDLAKAKSIVDEALPEAEVLPRAIALAASYAAKAHPVMATLKRDMYPATAEALRVVKY
ncbi:MAG: enoyl-CoA hydratase/carnithine racemase [Myxococcota bacterium]